MTEVIELRQYTLHPGKRDVLIELFDREFVESQEAVGMRIIGQFRDLERPDRFVWVRGFDSMAVRGAALPAFYGGPVWKAHSAAANATMIDVDDVLLLRPAGTSFDLDPAVRGVPPTTTVVATIHFLAEPADERTAGLLDGIRPLATLRTLDAENNFPALPVRTGEHVLVWFASHPDVESARAAQPPPIGIRHERLLLAPTARSMLR
jgi:hypothetical protein